MFENVYKGERTVYTVYFVDSFIKLNFTNHNDQNENGYVENIMLNFFFCIITKLDSSGDARLSSNTLTLTVKVPAKKSEQKLCNSYFYDDLIVWAFFSSDNRQTTVTESFITMV